MKSLYPGQKVIIVASVLFPGMLLSAQVIELKAGSSSLYQSQGGSMTVHGKSYRAIVGAGTIGGQLFVGAQIMKQTERTLLTVGSDNLPFDLPTDIFDPGHYLTVIGGSVRFKTEKANIYAFLGATSTSFDSPFFEGAHAETPAAILFANKALTPQWTAAAKVVLSKQFTTISSIAWHSGETTKFAVSAGLGSNQPYGAASLEMHRKSFDLQAAYIGAGNQFRRVNTATLLTSEPDRENIALTVHPVSYFSISVGRQNYLTPVYQSNSNVRSTVNQASGTVQLKGFTASAMIFQSSYDQGRNIATAYSVTRSITPGIRVQTTYLVSKPDDEPKTSSMICNLEEVIGPRITLSQMVNTSGGRNTLGFGGSFLSNFATFSADYQTYYVPSQTSAPFEQALILNMQVNLWGRLTLDAGTFVAPNGHMLYTSQAEGTVSRQMATQSGGSDHPTMGGMTIEGQVLDADGQPVMGAALLLDKLPIYSDTEGRFYLRERKTHEHILTVLTADFLNGGVYRVVSAPTEITSGPKEQAGTIIVVLRVK